MGSHNAAGTAPAFAGGVGTTQSAMNLPANAFQRPPGMMAPAPVIQQLSSPPSTAKATTSKDLTAVSKNMQPFLNSLQARKGGGGGQFNVPQQQSFVAPPTDQTGTMGPGFYGG